MTSAAVADTLRNDRLPPLRRLRAWIDAQLEYLRKEDMRRAMHRFSEHVWSEGDEQVGAIAVPALILAWDTDPVHPLSSAEYLADTLPDATLHISTAADDVRTWTDRIEKFLQD